MPCEGAKTKVNPLHVAKSAIWRFNFFTQPTNRRFGDPEGSKAAQFSPTLAWTYVPCCHLHFYYSTLLLHPPPKPPPKQVGYPRQVSLEKFLKLGILDKRVGDLQQVRNYFRELSSIVNIF